MPTAEQSMSYERGRTENVGLLSGSAPDPEYFLVYLYTL